MGFPKKRLKLPSFTKCDYCAAITGSKVINSREQSEFRWRLRKCLGCGQNTPTVEIKQDFYDAMLAERKDLLEKLETLKKAIAIIE